VTNPPTRGHAELAAAFLDEALELSQPLLYRMNLRTGAYDYISRNVAHVTGYSPDEFAGRGWQGLETFILPEDGARVLAQLEAERRARPGRRLKGVVEYRFLTKSGEVRWLRDTYTQILAEDGTLEAIVGVAWDITAERRADEELRREQALVEAILRNLPFEVWARDVDGRIILQSEVSRTMWGDLMGKAFDVAEVPADVVAGWKERSRRALAGELVVHDWRHLAQGVEHIVHGVLAPIRQDGRIIGTIGANIDVTGLKRAEDEIRLLNASLEVRVAERTAELSASNRELEAFAYSVSHDLRAPLRALAGFSQVVLDDYGARLDDEGRELLGRIQAAAVRMARLIDDLLELSRVARVELRRSEVDVSALARKAIAELRELSPGRAVDVRIADGLVADGDPRLLGIVVENLLSNAWKFTAKTPDAAIEVGRELGADGLAWLYVRDNGVGFDMRFVDKIFGAFQRLHGVQEFPGTGIGLATAQRIIERHGGAIRAEAAPGKGATLYFRVPPPEPSERTASG
jgi:PAS domain S-box-containing protein